jgi:hypothetical protein
VVLFVEGIVGLAMEMLFGKEEEDGDEKGVEDEKKKVEARDGRERDEEKNDETEYIVVGMDEEGTEADLIEKSVNYSRGIVFINKKGGGDGEEGKEENEEKEVGEGEGKTEGGGEEEKAQEVEFNKGREFTVVIDVNDLAGSLSGTNFVFDSEYEVGEEEKEIKGEEKEVEEKDEGKENEKG